MNVVKSMSIMVFALGIAILAKYWGFHDFVESNAWIGLPMTVVGALGIVHLFDGR